MNMFAEIVFKSSQPCDTTVYMTKKGVVACSTVVLKGGGKAEENEALLCNKNREECPLLASFVSSMHWYGFWVNIIYIYSLSFTVPTNSQFVSITPNKTSFPVAEILTLECNTNLTANSYNWISNCVSTECFLLYEEEQNVSTLNRPTVKALTSIDVGNYTCNVTLIDGNILYASIYVNVSGIIL